MTKTINEFISNVNESLECEWIKKILQMAMVNNDEDFMKQFNSYFHESVRLYIE